MGNEANCTVLWGKQRHEGKALLESSELIFRGNDSFRLKIAFSSMKSVKAVNNELRVHTPEGLVVFELRQVAAKWCEKILHPKSRVEKLGVKPGSRVSLIGNFEPEFLAELAATTNNVTKGKVATGCDWIFFEAGAASELSQVAKLAKSIKGAAALWIIYPKGQKQITENDVLTGGRKAGLKDTKVVGFSQTHTALKFVIPAGQR
jgi:hypothetical protein